MKKSDIAIISTLIAGSTCAIGFIGIVKSSTVTPQQLADRKAVLRAEMAKCQIGTDEGAGERYSQCIMTARERVPAW
jgi:hypothetical protein